MKQRGTLFGRSFWSRGYCVSTVGLDEKMIQEYIQNQERNERDQEQGELFQWLFPGFRLISTYRWVARNLRT
jgi:hypothetical protein